MAKVEIRHEVEERGVRFRLVEIALLKRESVVPLEQWSTVNSAVNVVGLGQLVAWQDEEAVHADADSILVPHPQISKINVSLAEALSLPEVAPFVLNLQHAGTLDQKEFRFKPSWLKSNGQRQLGVKRIGALLTVGSRQYRLPTELYNLLESTDEFNFHSEKGADERLYHWSLIQELLPNATAESITTDGYINSTRVAHAAAFSLDLKSGIEGFTFDPVLFGPKEADRATDGSSEKDEDVIVSETEQLLPPAQQSKFTKERFAQFDECKPRYALGDGWYVVFDREAQQALTAVRKVQKADRETRRKFVKNPRAYIRGQLGEQVEEAVLERLFIETAEYSQRVRDVGLWEPVVLPWVAKTSEAWLPERFGLKVGEKLISVEPEQVANLKARANEALSQNKKEFEWAGEKLPANSETLEAINYLVGLEKPAKKDTGSHVEEQEGVEDAPGGPVVLVIEQNLDEVEFMRTASPRARAVDDDLPSTLKTSLKSHQFEGLRWLKESWAAGNCGVLLADDMGLGKTLQALGFLAWLRERMTAGTDTKRPILMATPAGLLKNWREEHETHFHLPGLGDELIAYGADLKGLRRGAGREIDVGEALLDADQLNRADWVLTTYETLRDYQHSFAAVHFAAIVYDEVQKIKTPGTIMTRAAKAMNGDFILALTGTPVENRLADLWCIMDTLQPGTLGDLKAFSQKYESEPDETDLRELKDRLMLPQDSMPAAMLRRMKSERLQDMPAKHEHPIERQMPAIQAERYSAAIQEAKNSSSKGAMLQALQSFKSISLHPVHPEQANNANYIASSARLSATFEVLENIQAKSEKALIFLESREMQPVVAALIQRHFKLKAQPMLISGAVTGAKRQERVNAFQKAPNGFDVIILSPRAGGVGLTLTAANHVIHLSRWWNPAVEDQCTDRVYRIGQNREVHVYYPMATHPAFADSSFDLRLHALLERKRSLSREMLMPPVDADADAANLFGQTIGDDDVTSASAQKKSMAYL